MASVHQAKNIKGQKEHKGVPQRAFHIYSSRSPISMGDLFQDKPWMPETAGTREPIIENKREDKRRRLMCVIL